MWASLLSHKVKFLLWICSWDVDALYKYSVFQEYLAGLFYMTLCRPACFLVKALPFTIILAGKPFETTIPTSITTLSPKNYYQRNNYTSTYSFITLYYNRFYNWGFSFGWVQRMNFFYSIDLRPYHNIIFYSRTSNFWKWKGVAGEYILHIRINILKLVLKGTNTVVLTSIWAYVISHNN